MELKRVVVTGLGALTPIGNSWPEFWKNLLNGVSGAGPITRWDATPFKTRFACEVKNFDFSEHFPINIKEIRKMDLFTQFALASTKEAILDAQLDMDKINKERAGVVWGTGIGGSNTYCEELVGYAKDINNPRLSPFFIPKCIGDMAAGNISIYFDLRGPNYITSSACSSSANAISDAFNIIRLGKADWLVVGGSEAPINCAGLGGFNAMMALSTRNDDPKTASRPFDRDRDGFVLGEGAASIILEDLDHALKRGAKIYAEIAGVGLSSDAYHITAPHPSGNGAVLSMRNALEDAELPLDSVDHINTHGTSTPIGDIMEIKAIVSLFGEHAYTMHLNAIKSMIGHLLGGAGAIEAVATILSIYYDLIPPTINHFADDDRIDNKLNYTYNHYQERKVNVAISNSFGFGGHNVSILFKKYKA